MGKLKNEKMALVLNILKSCLIGLVVTLIGTVILAVILKFADIPTKAVAYINDVIKAISLFVVVLMLKKSGDEKLLLKSIFAGVVYAVLAFVVFSILNGGFSFGLNFVFDVLFAVVVAIVASIILKLTSRKTA